MNLRNIIPFKRKTIVISEDKVLELGTIRISSKKEEQIILINVLYAKIILWKEEIKC